VFDIPVENPEESMRLINHMNAAFNSKPAEYGQASMSTQFIEPEHAVRIMLWGGLDLMETMTGMLAAYLRGRIGEDGNWERRKSREGETGFQIGAGAGQDPDPVPFPD
jgi:hypothetical protein